MACLLGEERCEQKWLPCGHVVAIATAQYSFIPSIVQAFEKLERLRDSQQLSTDALEENV